MSRVPLEERSLAERGRGEAALAVLGREAAKWGVALDGLDWRRALFSLQRDPYSGEEALLARWTAGDQRGTLTVRQDGYVYAEWDVATRHPAKPDVWIEAVVCWGMPPQLKSEPRLIEMPR